MRVLVPVPWITYKGFYFDAMQQKLFFNFISVYGQTEAVKDMEAKLEEQEQNKLYLDQLLAMLKDRDPTLLHVINSSLASR